MNEENVIEVIYKLVGEINPIGETTTDDERYENLNIMIKVVDILVGDINDVTAYRNRVEYSMKKAGIRAAEYIDELRSLLED